MKELPPGPPEHQPRRRYHQTDREAPRGENPPFHVTASDTDYCDGTGPILWRRQSPRCVALPSPDPLAVDSAQGAAGKAFSGRSCRPCAGPEAYLIVAHDAETGDELWWRLVPARGEPGDETWGDMLYEDRVHVRS